MNHLAFAASRLQDVRSTAQNNRGRFLASAVGKNLREDRDLLNRVMRVLFDAHRAADRSKNRRLRTICWDALQNLTR